MNIIFLISVVLNILLNVILIRSLRAEGAAIATFVTQSFALLAQIILGVRLGLIGVDWRLLVRLSVFTGSMLGLAWTIQTTVEHHWWLRFGVVVAGGLILASLFRMLHLPALLELIRTRTVERRS